MSVISYNSARMLMAQSLLLERKLTTTHDIFLEYNVNKVKSGTITISLPGKLTKNLIFLLLLGTFHLLYHHLFCFCLYFSNSCLLHVVVACRDVVVFWCVLLSSYLLMTFLLFYHVTINTLHSQKIAFSFHNKQTIMQYVLESPQFIFILSRYWLSDNTLEVFEIFWH